MPVSFGSHGSARGFPSMRIVFPTEEMVSPGSPITLLTRSAYSGSVIAGGAAEDDDVSSVDRRRELVHDETVADLQRREHRPRRHHERLGGVGTDSGGQDHDAHEGRNQHEGGSDPGPTHAALITRNPRPSA